VLNPYNLGARAAALAAIFSMWRFKKVIFKYNYTTASTGTGAVGTLGILDDSLITEGDGPTTTQGVLELRTSCTNYNQNPPTTLEYAPPTSAWYHTYAGATGSEPRLVSCGVVYVGSIVTTTYSHTLEIDYVIVFKGAVDVGSTVHDGYSLVLQPAPLDPLDRGHPKSTTSDPTRTRDRANRGS